MKSVKSLFVLAFMAFSVCFANAQGVSKVNEASFFKAKFTKDRVWDAQRFPANPIAGQNWTISGLKGALDATGSTIDWGTGRFLMFVAEVDNVKSTNSLVDDANKTIFKYNVSLKLFENNGTLVKVVSKWGNLIGIGDKGFMYELEGRYGSFFSITDLKATSIIQYKPSIAKVMKLSDIVNSTEAPKLSETLKAKAEIVQNNLSKEKTEITSNSSPKAKPEIVQNIAAKAKEIIKPLVTPKTNSTFDIFKTKYKKDQVWEVQLDESGDPSKVTYIIKGPAVYEHNGEVSLNNWGKNNDRYMKFAIGEGSDDYWQITDDVNKKKGPFYLSVEMFETTGEQSGRGGYGYNGVKILDLGSQGFVMWKHSSEGDVKLFFSKTSLKATDKITYIPIKKEVTKLSEIQAGAF